MIKRLTALVFAAALLVVAALPTFAAGPNFGPAIFADDETWGTKGTTDLPGPNGHNEQSFDGLYKFPDSGVVGQLPVAEAAPGPHYNGGRWIEYNVTWVGTPELVTSFAQLQMLIDSGDVTVTETGNYFQCPLLPVKD